MRLVAILPYFYPRIGGGETHLWLLGSCLVKRHGIEVTVLTQRLPGTAPTETFDGIHILRLGDALTRSGQTMAYRGFAQYVSDCPDDAVFYVYFSVGSVFRMRIIAELLEACIRNSKRLIVRIPSTGRVTEAAAQDKYFRDLLCGADAVLALNADIRAELAAIGIRGSRIVHIANAIDSAVFRPDPVARTRVRRRLNLSGSTTLALSVSRLAYKKRIPEIIQTWGTVHKMVQLPPRSLLIIGGDTQEHVCCGHGALLRESAASAASMFYLGEQSHEDVPQYYAAADIFLSYSTQEGMSNSLLEAMSSGLVAVAPSTAATLGICDDASNFLYRQDDSEMRHRQLVRAFSIPRRERREMGIVNARRAMTDFSLESMGDKFHSLLRRVAATSREARCLSPLM